MDACELYKRLRSSIRDVLDLQRRVADSWMTDGASLVNSPALSDTLRRASRQLEDLADDLDEVRNKEP